MTSRNPAGRPPEGGPGQTKNAPINFRTSPKLRDALLANAVENDCSLAKEVEYRVRRSFEVDDLLQRILKVLDAPR